MGCAGAREKIEDQMMLMKLECMEVQMEKETELKKLSDMEGHTIKRQQITQIQNLKEKNKYIMMKKKGVIRRQMMPKVKKKKIKKKKTKKIKIKIKKTNRIKIKTTKRIKIKMIKKIKKVNEGKRKKMKFSNCIIFVIFLF